MFVVCTALMTPVVWLIGVVKGVEGPWQLHVGVGVFTGTAFSMFLYWYLSHQARDLELARLGDRMEIEQRARAQRVDPLARFALLVACGQLEQAELVLQSRIEPRMPFAKKVAVPLNDRVFGINNCRLALELAREGRPAAERVIAQLDLTGGEGLLETPSTAASRYLRAHVLASAAAVADRSGTERALAKLEAPKLRVDSEMRAYAQWLRAKLDVSLDDGERVEDAERGAALARHAGYQEIAQMVDRRATLLRAQRARHAYR